MVVSLFLDFEILSWRLSISILRGCLAFKYTLRKDCFFASLRCRHGRPIENRLAGLWPEATDYYLFIILLRSPCGEHDTAFLLYHRKLFIF